MILNGDALEMLKTLPDESVDCCVTSPPYYALRDYGTGKWVGGDPDCPHKRMSKFSDKITTGHKQPELIGMVGDAIYKSVCPLCGAVREDKQIGLEDTPEGYINRLSDVFDEVRRVMKDDGTLWLNIADSYWGSGSRGYDFTGKFTEASEVQSNSQGTIDLHNLPELKGRVGEYKNKDMIGIPWMLAFELRKRGWYLRQDIIWHKPNPMPESVTDRCTKSHEYIFLLSKSQRYYFDHEAIQERANYDGRKAVTFAALTSEYDGTEVEVNYKRSGKNRWQWKNLNDKGQTTHSMHERRAEGLPDKVYHVRNKRDVWTVTTKALKEAHFATYPTELIEPCILAGSRRGGWFSIRSLEVGQQV